MSSVMQTLEACLLYCGH